ncbi:TrkH family potassium uptake protein [Ruminococcaceae bacterium OttesenSCG-928-N02]|nr:TrkH family potassium uptake protein [Ruminococcaceae bacterium OttesenSCG-928-N02]
MRERIHRYILGWVCLIEALFLLAPAAVALIYGEGIPFWAFAGTIAILGAIGALFCRKKPSFDALAVSDGYIIAAQAWVIMSFFGALPFYFSGAIPSFIDCLFESVSGFTTTGASILTAVETTPMSMLFWRALSHWVGGMGVLVFLMAVVSMAGGRSVYLLRAETTGPKIDKLVPQMRLTAKALYKLYIVLTVVLLALLLAGGMPVFDSFCTAFSVAGTGGFGIKDSSIGFYQSPYLQWVITIFMLVFGVNFNVYFLLAKKKIKEALKNEELFVFLAVCALAIFIIAGNIAGMYTSGEETVRTAAFQVASIVSTTGYSTVDFNLWPELSKCILVLLMFMGSCAGSTAGGIKVIRFVILIKASARNLRTLANPHSVHVVRLNGRTLEEDVVNSTATYFFMCIMIFAISVLLLCTGGYGLTSSFTAVAACLNNIGPGLDMFGPASNFSAALPWHKLVLIVNMLIGRLEILPMLMLFSAPFRRGRSTRLRQEKGFAYGKLSL